MQSLSTLATSPTSSPWQPHGSWAAAVIRQTPADATSSNAATEYTC